MPSVKLQICLLMEGSVLVFKLKMLFFTSGKLLHVYIYIWLDAVSDVLYLFHITTIL